MDSFTATSPFYSSRQQPPQNQLPFEKTQAEVSFELDPLFLLGQLQEHSLTSLSFLFFLALLS